MRLCSAGVLGFSIVWCRIVAAKTVVKNHEKYEKKTMGKLWKTMTNHEKTMNNQRKTMQNHGASSKIKIFRIFFKSVLGRLWGPVLGLFWYQLWVKLSTKWNLGGFRSEEKNTMVLKQCSDVWALSRSESTFLWNSQFELICRQIHFENV